MNDLISREAVLKLILSGRVGDDTRFECPEECNSMLEWAADEVAKMPTVDAVEVVRCKNCECWYPEEDGEYGHCRKHDFWAPGNWYCADPERREDERMR